MGHTESFEIIDKSHEDICLEVFEILETEGSHAFLPGGSYAMVRNPHEIVDPLMDHYVSKEDYEKCSFLRDILESF